MLSPGNGKTIPEGLDSTAHELQLNLGFGQRHHLLPSRGSNTRGKNPEAEGRIKRMKRERDRKYREKEKEIKEKQTQEICKLKEENAVLQEELSKYKEKEDHMGREIASYKEKILQFQAEIVQLRSMLDRQTLTAEAGASQPAGSKAAELEQRYGESKRENALLKNQLKMEKRVKKVMEKALLERIMKLESMGKQDIEPSSSYTHSEHSSM